MIHIEMRIESEMLSLRELQKFVGKEVEIVIIEKASAEPVEKVSFPPPPWPLTCPTVEEVARQQGKTPKRIEDLPGGWPEDERDDGFEEWLRISRKYELLAARLKLEASKHLFRGATQ